MTTKRFHRDGDALVSPSGRYRIEGQEAVRECEHPDCSVLHQRHLLGRRGAAHEVVDRYWIIWDTQANDYAGAEGGMGYERQMDARKEVEKLDA